jgi:crotonobetainyl-CoA:carnitine CoA-transferase CaiB-like acyl-CoA transferase
MGHPELVDDPRFIDHQTRGVNSRDCTQVLKKIFQSRTLAEWREALTDFEGVWSPLQSPLELHDDPAIVANHAIRSVVTNAGPSISLACNPVQFDGEPPVTAGAPEHGQDTEIVLLDAGYDWDELEALKASGAIL